MSQSSFPLDWKGSAIARWVKEALCICSEIVGSLLVVKIVFLDIPLMTGMLYISVPDIESPGHLLCFGVSIPQFLVELITAVLIIRFSVKRRTSGPDVD